MSHQIYITATKARNNFFDLIKKVKKGPYPMHVTIDGIPQAVIMSQDDYDSWMATYETLSDPELVDQLRESKKDIKAGRTIPWEKVKKELRLERVSGRAHKESTKGVKKVSHQLQNKGRTDDRYLSR